MDDAGDLLRAYVEAGDAADVAQLTEILSPEVVTHAPGGTTTRGVGALQASWAAAHRGVGRLRHDVQRLLVDGDTAVARVVVTGTHTGPFLGVAATGADLRVDQALFVRVEQGRVVELWEVVDTGAGLRQLGVLGDQQLSPG